MKVNIIPHPTRAGWYYLDYRPEGSKGKRQRDKVEGYENACAMRDEIERHYAEPLRRVETHPRINQVYDEYMLWVKANQAPATYANKKCVFKSIILPHFGEYRVRNLTQRVYDEFQKKLGEKRKEIILCQAYLGAMIKWMTKRDMCKGLDFTPETPKYNRPVHIIPHPVDLEEAINLIDSEPKRVMFQLMLLSGLRWNETAQIRWEQIDLKAWAIRLIESDQEQNDIVPIPEALRPWFTANKKRVGWVFPNPHTIKDSCPEGKPYVSLKKALNTAAKKVGVHLHPHLFRHASATYLYAANRDIKAVQGHLRQKDIRSTLIYVKYSVDQVQDGQEALAEHMEMMKKKYAQKIQDNKIESEAVENTDSYII